MFNGSDFSGHLKGAFESLGHNFAIEEVSLDNLSSRQAMQPSCTVCCVGDEVMKSQASLYVLAESLEFKSSVFLIPRNAIELALLLGRMGCERVFPIPENTSDSDAWLFVATQVQQLIGAVSSREGARKSMIFSDPKSKSMLALIERVAGVEVSTLLTGESGVGKEVVATILHKMSARARKPFIAVNCAAIPENLVESFLFGHCKGAFTGAFKDQPGVFEEADGGIVFLDEVGELPLHVQPKLLRLLQERRSARVGAHKEHSFDVRVLAATNQDLHELVKQKKFREDLFYRINAFHIRIPSLRERTEDIKNIALFCASSLLIGGCVAELTEEAIQKLISYGWPGNVRELENVICRAKVLAVAAVIEPQHIVFDSVSFVDEGSDPSSSSLQSTSDVPQGSASSLSASKEELEQQWILRAIEETSTREEAAAVLGISPRTLRHKLQKFKQFGSMVTEQRSEAIGGFGS